MTQVVRHRTRIVGEDFKYTESGETSWPFEAKGDGEIFDDSTRTNIAGYTINGAPPTIPFALVNGQSYQIAITKTTTGQTSELLLKTRRAVNKTNNINVPDFGAYDGRYQYALEATTGVLHKVDSDLLLSSNYEGAGVWTVSPVVSVINLPTLPVNFIWNALGFVKSAGLEKILCWAGDTTYSNTWYACFVYVGSNEVYNIAEDTLDSYTEMFVGAAKYGLPYNFIYDYIAERCYFKTISGTNGLILTGIDLNTKGFITKTSGNLKDLTNYLRITNYYLNPITQRFLGNITDVSEDDYTHNYKGDSVNSEGAIYDKTTGYSVVIRNNSTIQWFIDASGVLQASYSSNAGVYNDEGMLLVRDAGTGINYICLLETATNRTRVAFVELGTIRKAQESPLSILASGQTQWKNGDQAPCDRNGLTVCFGGDGDGAKRLYVLKPEFVGETVEARYLDFANDLISLESNQLRV